MTKNSDTIESLPLDDKYWDYFKELVQRDGTSSSSDIQQLVHLYFGKGNKCPKCHKGSIVKGQEGDYYTMKCGDNCSWNVKFKPPRTVNLYYELQKYRRLSDAHSEKLRTLIEKKQLETYEDLSKLTEEYKEVQKLLALSNENIQKLTKILDLSKIPVDKLINEKFDQSHELYLLSVTRTNVYKSIHEMIPESKLEQIKKVYKNEGVAKDSKISRVAKNVGISAEDTKNWLLWLDASKSYIELQEKINETTKEIESLKNKTLNFNQNYPVNKGEIMDKQRDIKRIVIENPNTVPRTKKVVRKK